MAVAKNVTKKVFVCGLDCARSTSLVSSGICPVTRTAPKNPKEMASKNICPIITESGHRLFAWIS
jgi:hypothetical protein